MQETGSQFSEAAQSHDRQRRRHLSVKQRLEAFGTVMLGTSLCRGVGASLRYEIRREADLETFRSPQRHPLIYAIWHGSFLPLLYYYRHHGACVVTSQSDDGQILTRILTNLGYTTVRGSSTRGGGPAVINLARQVKRGVDAIIAVDGPRGPAYQAKPGIVLLGKRTGYPIVPIIATVRSYWRFQSWDRFRLPLPFSRALLVVGDPIHVPPDAFGERIEDIRSDLERTMLRIQKETDDEMQPRIFCLPDRQPRDIKYWSRRADVHGESRKG